MSITEATPRPRSPDGVSAVVATVDRTEPLRRLLDSLLRQTHPPDEVIIVDQNLAPLPASILFEKDWPFLLRHIHCSGRRGVSHARNIGWRQAEGTWLLFPDDDCWYPADFIARAVAIARRERADILTGRAASTSGKTINGRFEKAAGWVSYRSVLTSQIEWNMLVRRNAMMQLGGYDDTISLGGNTPWQGGEGYDLLFRAIAFDMPCRYDPDLIAHHAELPVGRPDVAMCRKGRDYARGLGHVLAIHGFGLLGACYWTARSLANLGFSLAGGRADRARYYLHQAVGRLEGFFGRLVPVPRYPPRTVGPDGQTASHAGGGEVVPQ